MEKTCALPKLVLGWMGAGTDCPVLKVGQGFLGAMNLSKAGGSYLLIGKGCPGTDRTQ